ncbi:MAG TPA: carboxypeptidase regulatory-like domain-containing protein [Bacteroidota bacterium]|nr:carboxypeptidase regulatory-like domain-containing protein [Bacteroidota bacterium]
MTPHWRTLTIVLVSIFCASFCRQESMYAQSTYKEIALTNGGTIRGTVRLKGDVSEVERMEISKDIKSCGKAKRSPRLIVGKNFGIGDAIVYLAGVKEGKTFDRKGSYLINQQHCEYVPHTLIVPVGAQLEIVNKDPILHNVHTYFDGKPPKTLFNIAQPIKGLCMKSKPLQKTGLILATCDAGHPWMSAHIMVTDHPYYAVTDKNGGFILEAVPPGSYELKLWHEGVAIVNRVLDQGKTSKYEFEPAYEDGRQVVVAENAETIADFELVLR